MSTTEMKKEDDLTLQLMREGFSWVAADTIAHFLKDVVETEHERQLIQKIVKSRKEYFETDTFTTVCLRLKIPTLLVHLVENQLFAFRPTLTIHQSHYEQLSSMLSERLTQALISDFRDLEENHPIFSQRGLSSAIHEYLDDLSIRDREDDP